MGPRSMLMLTVDDARGASTRYRVLAHRPALHAAGITSALRLPLTVDAAPLTRPAWRALDLLRDVAGTRGDADVLFVHRKTYPPLFAARLRRKNQPVVYDLDDAIDLPPPDRPQDPATLARYRANFEATLRAADLVLAGNRDLAERAGHASVEILPTPIDTERFAPGKTTPARGPVLGWVGHSSNLGYLESLAEPLRAVARRHPGLRLVVVADRPPRLDGVDVEFRRWSLENELSCFDGIAVGLMPLDDTPWARAKCAFKAIQYMALGIPAVASPVGMNREVIVDGESGFLPATPAAWVEALDALLRDPDLARRIAAAGRATVERDYALPVVSRRLIELLNALPARRV